MRKLILSLAVACCSTLFLASCHDDAPQIPANKLPVDHTEENLKDFNEGYMEFEADEIKHYIDSLQLKMDTTEEGIHYQILKKGDGKKLKEGDKVTIHYTVSLLDGSDCKELTDVEKTYTIGMTDIVKGYDVATKLLTKGGSGDFIIPALLAYGVSGYKCVPRWTPIRCKLSVKEVESK